MFEVIIALTVIALVLTTLMSLVTLTIKNSSTSRLRSLATRYSNEAIEWVRGERDTSWTIFYTTYTASSPKIYCLPSLAWTPGQCGAVITGTILKRELTLTRDTIDPANIVNADARTFWTDSSGTHEVKVTTDFTSWNSQ